MVKTIGNPGSWAVEAIGEIATLIGRSIASLGGRPTKGDLPAVAEIGIEDVRAALRAGAEDFAALRSDVIFLILVYPLIGGALALFAYQGSLLHLIFPAAAGFAILGPFAAIGLYELTRRREAGEDVHWSDALTVFRSDRIAAILALGSLLMLLFVIWIGAAQTIYAGTLGPEPPASLGAFMREVLTTGPGWAMTAIGVAVGAVFATVALAISLVSFPILIDRDCGLPVALITSLTVVAKNPGTAATWGIIVVAGLVLGTLPAFLGLIVVLPVLGHATWHLYRRAVPRA